MSAEDEIVGAVRHAVGDRPVLLAGSRAAGGARVDSDWDVIAVLPAALVPLCVPRLRRVSDQLSQRLGTRVSVNPLPARFLRDARRLFVWKLLREGRVLYAPRGFTLPAAPAPALSDQARFSFALSGLLYLREQKLEHARRVVAQLRTLARGAYATEPNGDVPREADTLRNELMSFAQPFPSSSPARTFARNLQYALLSQLRGRRRWRALLWREPADHKIAREVLAGGGDASEWESAHPLLGI